MTVVDHFEVKTSMEIICILKPIQNFGELCAEKYAS
jgi:hypothetical protein